MLVVATDLRPGNIVVHNGQLHRILTVTHITPGNWRGMVHTKMRNLKTGSQLEHRFRSEDRVDKASFDTHEMQYRYSDPSGHHFMNMETYEQIALSDEVLGDSRGYLLPETVITVDFYEERPVAIELPNTVVLQIVDTEPVMKNANATGSYKPAKLENGITVNVPPYIEAGEKIRVNTTDRTYMERVK